MGRGGGDEIKMGVKQVQSSLCCLFFKSLCLYRESETVTAVFLSPALHVVDVSSCTTPGSNEWLVMKSWAFQSTTCRQWKHWVTRSVNASSRAARQEEVKSSQAASSHQWRHKCTHCIEVAEGRFPSSCPESDHRESSPLLPAPAPSHAPSHQAHFVYQHVSKAVSSSTSSPSSFFIFFLRCHLIGFLRCDITGCELRKESRQPVLSFSRCLRVQPGQALFQKVILGTREYERQREGFFMDIWEQGSFSWHIGGFSLDIWVEGFFLQGSHELIFLKDHNVNKDLFNCCNERVCWKRCNYLSW